jgi:hypothetical protein
MKSIKLKDIECEIPWNKRFLKRVCDAWFKRDLIALSNLFQQAQDPQVYDSPGEWIHPIANLIFDMKGNYVFTECNGEAISILRQAIDSAGVPDVYTQHMLNAWTFEYGTDKERESVLANQGPYVLERMPESVYTNSASSSSIYPFYDALRNGKSSLSLNAKADLCNHILRFYTPARKLELYDFTKDKVEAQALKDAVKPEYQDKVEAAQKFRPFHGYVIERC